MSIMRHMAAATLALSAFATVGGCDLDEPAADRAFNRYELLTIGGSDSDELTLSGVTSGTIALIDGAEHRVWLAASRLTDEGLAQALIDAADRGVDVRVVADEESAPDAGLQRLLLADFTLLNLLEDLGERGNATLPAPRTIRLADGATIHSPEPGVEIPRPGSMNNMTHNFVLIDATTLVNITGGFGGASDDAIRTGFIAQSEDLVRDFEDEFRQLASGVDATKPSAYGGPVKAITDGRTIYPGTIADFGLYFGPQERTLKRLIDDAFGVRASLWIATEELSNEFLCRAILYKLRTAFDVRVVVRQPLDATRTIVGSTCDTLADAFAGNPVQPGFVQELRVAPNLATNLIVMDALGAPDGVPHQSRAIVMSQPMLPSFTFRTGANTPLTADAFTDANMWVVRQFPAHPEPAFEVLADQFNSIWEGAQ